MLNNASSFQSLMLTWYYREKRTLPWRENKNPYYIWVSEIMLQQTQVATVIPYFNRFISRFPTLAILAEAELDEVLKLWEGLGYYSRARNLHAAARQLIKQGHNCLPSNWDDLKHLPGIGDYTAAAILSIAFDIPAPAVDGNIKRVFSRLLKIADPVNKPSSLKTYQKLAETYMSHNDPGGYNQALMELGAMVCKPKQPSCGQCPVNSLCASYKEKRVDQYPVVEKRPKTPVHQIAVGVVLRDGKVLITKRAEQGLLGGLWEFPGGKLNKGETASQACIREIKEETDLQVEIIERLTLVKHAYTHFKIEMAVYMCRYLAGEVKLSGPTDFRWIEMDQIDQYPFPKANHKFIPAIGEWILRQSPI